MTTAVIHYLVQKKVLTFHEHHYWTLKAPQPLLTTCSLFLYLKRPPVHSGPFLKVGPNQMNNKSAQINALKHFPQIFDCWLCTVAPWLRRFCESINRMYDRKSLSRRVWKRIVLRELARSESVEIWIICVRYTRNTIWDKDNKFFVMRNTCCYLTWQVSAGKTFNYSTVLFYF